ncbi:MAG: M81 family metallopeptidase [Chloroflexi bacterium]|nr:M81 family metallopeptidase [Chloroflexota bacterium]
MRIAIGNIGHETNTFSNRPTDLAEFRRSWQFPGLLLGDEVLSAFAGTRTCQGGFIGAAHAEALELVPLLWTMACPAGPVTRPAFDYLLDELLDRLRRAGPVDGVLLDLHGAMVVEGDDDGEGCVLSAIREAVGEGVPIISTLDLHANITPLMVEKADALVGYDTYPHVDMYERGVEATRLMAATLRRELRPTMALRQPPLLAPPPGQFTGRFPMTRVLALAHEMEAADVVTATVACGFPYADIACAGVATVAVTNGDTALAERRANELADLAWELRAAFAAPAMPPAQAVEEAMAEPGLVVLADVGDNPGGGTPADGTVLLRALIEKGARRAALAAIADPEAVAACVAAGVGNKVALRLGGKSDRLHGEPLDVVGRVRVLSDGSHVIKGPMMTGVRVENGRTAVLDCDGVEVVITENRIQPLHLEIFRSVGIEPTDRQIVAVKSSAHFRAAFEPIARRVIEVDCPGITTPNLRSLPYRNVRRPIYPLDEMESQTTSRTTSQTKSQTS